MFGLRVEIEVWEWRLAIRYWGFGIEEDNEM